MFTLTFTDPKGGRQSHPVLEEEQGLVVGREPSCDVVLTSKEVSRRHARFFVEGGELFVEDLGSHNGVTLAGARLEARTRLAAAAELELGDVRVTVGATQASPARAPAAPRPAPTRAPAPGLASGAAPGAAPAARSAAAPAAAGKASPATARAAAAKAPANTAAARAGGAAVSRSPAPDAGRTLAPDAGRTRAPDASRPPAPDAGRTLAPGGAKAGPARAPARPAPPAAAASPRPAPAAAAPVAEPAARPAGVGAGAVLRGLGQFASVQIALPAVATVGRGKDCDVVLDDGSVSRRHAKLSRDDRGHYRLEDEGSGNGTFVDGQRIEGPTLLADGVKLRFGDVELLFWRPPAAAGLPRRQRLLLLAGAGLIVLFVALYFVKQRRGENQLEEESPGALTHAAQLAEQAQASLASDRFDEAARVAQQAIDVDPVAVAPRKILAQVRREQQAQKLFEGATAKAQVGREEEALQLFAQMDPQSRFFPRARIQAKALAQTLLRSRSAACKGAAGRGDLQQVQTECTRALDVKCQLQPVDDDPMLRSLRTVEKRLGRRQQWSCPANLLPLFRDEAVGGAGESVSTDRALRTRYPDAAVYEAIALYARGEAGNALRALTSGPAARGKASAMARDAAEKVRVVDGRFREGQTALLRGEVARADEIWAEALQADATLMPPGTQSFLAQQMRDTLAQAHAKAGDEKFAKGQYASAYDEWSKGLAASPKDAPLLDSLARLEKVADQILSAGSPSCDQLSVASHITRADPPSPAHVAAQKALEACQ